MQFMKQGKTNIQQYAMYFGTYMGVYWILKFILFPLGFTIPFLQFLFIGLTLGVPFMGYYYLKIYRDKICGGSISFSKAFIFTVMLYVFASLLTAVAHFVYFQFIDQGFIIENITLIINQFLEQVDEVPNLSETDVELMHTSANEVINTLAKMSAVDTTFNYMSRNIFGGIILALITALIGQRRPKITQGEI